MVTITLILLIAFPELIYCMVGDDVMVFNSSVGVLLTSSQYCFVNESTVRINDSDANIINNTGDWITAINGIDLFMAPANGTNCTSSTASVVPYSDTTYIIQIVIFIATILVILANIALHLFIKELQTVSGVLIVSLCAFILLNECFLLVYVSLTDQRDGDVCALIIYAALLPYFLYDTSKLSTLIHFSYLMYHSYKTSIPNFNKKPILCKYATLIVALSIILSASVILVDRLVSPTAFKTTHGRCTLFIDPSNYGSISIVLLTVEFSILNIVEIGFMIAGVVLYYLTTRQCCSMATRDVKNIHSIELHCWYKQ